MKLFALVTVSVYPEHTPGTDATLQLMSAGFSVANGTQTFAINADLDSVPFLSTITPAELFPHIAPDIDSVSFSLSVQDQIHDAAVPLDVAAFALSPNDVATDIAESVNATNLALSVSTVDFVDTDAPVAVISTITPSGYSVSLDASTSTGTGIDGWKWTISGSGGQVETAWTESPTIDMTQHGPDSYDVTLEVRDQFGVWSGAATDSFILSAPSTDDVAIGEPSYDFTTKVLTFPIDRANDNLGADLVAPARVTIDLINGDTMAVIDSKDAEWGDLPGSDWTDSLGLIWGGSITEGGSLTFQNPETATCYAVKFTTQGANSVSHEVTAYTPGRHILKAGGVPGGPSSVSTGAWQVDQNVTNGYWTWAQVQEYQYCELQYVQRLRQEDSDQFSDAVATVKAQVPGMQFISNSRYDLCRYGPGTPLRPDEAWGSGVHAEFAKPTFSMGASPRVPFPWYSPSHGNTMVDALTAAGYAQDANNKAQTDDAFGSSNLSCPYRIELDPNAMVWRAVENQMDISSPLWLGHIATALLKWQSLNPTVIDGIAIAPVKIQTASPAAPGGFERLAGWQFQANNPGWTLATDSGGQAGRESWGSRTRYDFTTNTVLDVLEGAWEMVRLLRAGNATMPIVFDTIYLHVAFGPTTRGYYETQFIAKYGGTAADAKQNYADRLKEMASLAHVMFAKESDPEFQNDGWDYIDLADRNEIREITRSKGERWIKYPPPDQTTI